MDRMKNVMMGNTKSHRHNLFLDKRELEQCNLLDLLFGRNMNSRLQQLNNPNFLGDENKWYTVVGKLNETVFLKFFSQADPKLKEVLILQDMDIMSMMYSIFVLFPETCIHRLEVIYILYLIFYR